MGKKSFSTKIKMKMKMTKSNIENKVSVILKNFGTEAPIPVQDIIDKLGIMVSYAASKDYSGILVRGEGGQILMGLNSDESFVRQRFTMAHELGHYFLDHSKSAFVDNKVMVNHRDCAENKKTHDKTEIDANYFAACLLMPKDSVEENFKQIAKNKIFLEDHLGVLAEKYEVSKEAMKYRLINLDLINI